jgi:MYXO-CTERM domain-containing protein
MKATALGLALLACAAAAPSAALADWFDFSYSGSNGVTAFGSVNATLNLDLTTYTAVDGFVTVDGGALQGTWALFQNANGTSASYSPSGAFIYDDQLLPSSDPVLTTYGLLFSDGAVEVNVWGNSPGDYSHWEFAGGGYQVSSDGQLSLSAAPAPGSVALLGLGGIVSLRRRRN